MERSDVYYTGAADFSINGPASLSPAQRPAELTLWAWDDRFPSGLPGRIPTAGWLVAQLGQVIWDA